MYWFYVTYKNIINNSDFYQKFSVETKLVIITVFSNSSNNSKTLMNTGECQNGLNFEVKHFEHLGQPIFPINFMKRVSQLRDK
jgi:hypothetical protein